jgi:predicted secreted protein
MGNQEKDDNLKKVVRDRTTQTIVAGINSLGDLNRLLGCVIGEVVENTISPAKASTVLAVSKQMIEVAEVQCRYGELETIRQVCSVGNEDYDQESQALIAEEKLECIENEEILDV